MRWRGICSHIVVWEGDGSSSAILPHLIPPSTPELDPKFERMGVAMAINTTSNVTLQLCWLLPAEGKGGKNLRSMFTLPLSDLSEGVMFCQWSLPIGAETDLYKVSRSHQLSETTSPGDITSRITPAFVTGAVIAVRSDCGSVHWLRANSGEWILTFVVGRQSRVGQSEAMFEDMWGSMEMVMNYCCHYEISGGTVPLEYAACRKRSTQAYSYTSKWHRATGSVLQLFIYLAASNSSIYILPNLCI